jgi:hypothetical protein
MRNILVKSCRDNQNTHLTFNNFFQKSCRFRDNVEKYSGVRGATNDVIIWRVGVARWISKTTCAHAHAHIQTRAHTHTHVIFIAFQQQQ